MGTPTDADGPASSPARKITWLLDLGEDECRRRLGDSTLGRLGVFVEGRPEIFPVNHVYDEASGCVVFPTWARTKLHAALDWPWVSFEVDGTEPESGVGWSVLVVGHAELVDDPSVAAAWTSMRTAPWCADEGVSWLRIVPHRITGRQITATTGPC